MMTFDVLPDGGEKFRVTATSRDISQWERTGKFRSIKGLEADAKMSQLEELAYTASVRKELFDGTLDSFRKTCDIVPVDESEVSDEGDESGPTRKGR